MSIQFPQTSVVDPLDNVFPGVLGSSSNKHTASKVSAETSAEIPFGVAVVRDSVNKDTGVVLPHTSAATSAPLFAGIVQHHHSYAIDVELGEVGIKPKITVQVLERGPISVLPEEPVAPGDPVRFRVVATGNEQAGAFRATQDGADCVNISSFARWVTSGNSTTTALLEIDIVNASLAQADI